MKTRENKYYESRKTVTPTSQCGAHSNIHVLKGTIAILSGDENNGPMPMKSLGQCIPLTNVLKTRIQNRRRLKRATALHGNSVRRQHGAQTKCERISRTHVWSLVIPQYRNL